MSAPVDTTFLTDRSRMCAGRADVFCNVALDYTPDGEDYAEFTEEQHAQAAAAKTEAENTAIDLCLDCPVMVACRAYALAHDVSGVAGGETESARRELRAAAGLVTPSGEAAEETEQDTNEQAPATAPIENTRGNTTPAVCPSDRGVRGQIDDATVAYLSRAGMQTEQIAREMGCSVRSITRARARLRRAEEAAATAAATTTSPVATPAPAAAPTSAAVACLSARTTGMTFGPDRRRVSAAMAAIYDVLADGQWHHQNDLVAVGMRHITDEEAIAWWATRYKKQIAADPTFPDTVARETKIAYGARDKVLNALSASTRNRARTERGGEDGGDQSMFRSTERALTGAAA